ncbi:expressed unknown protein [Seminavis robusta]|uniref:Transmembrane protein n=1 Tax=Seminavis robusta TaxID=568900 RepID=A0A9N8HMY8_9STRA|nr:expressed unknown protein [Seminavis robusta]|eukprot:Sro782_g201760.1 n/a (230) ;mRNA; r:28091-28780
MSTATKGSAFTSKVAAAKNTSGSDDSANWTMKNDDLPIDLESGNGTNLSADSKKLEKTDETTADDGYSWGDSIDDWLNRFLRWWETTSRNLLHNLWFVVQPVFVDMCAFLFCILAMAPFILVVGLVCFVLAVPISLLTTVVIWAEGLCDFTLDIVREWPTRGRIIEDVFLWCLVKMPLILLIGLGLSFYSMLTLPLNYLEALKMLIFGSDGCCGNKKDDDSSSVSTFEA